MATTLKDIGIRCVQEQTNVGGTLEYEAPINLTIGNEFQGDCAIGAFSYINAHGCFFGTRMGRYCSVANWVVAGPGAHDTSRFAMHPFVFDPEGAISGLGDFPDYRKILGHTPISSTLAPAMTASKAIEIGHDVWIGTRAIIMKGVKIGHGAVIAAGAIVTRDVAPYMIVAGVPAKPIRPRFEAPVIKALLELQWWDYDMSAVSNKVNYGKPTEVIDFMRRALAKGELKKFRPDVMRIERTGTTFNISRKAAA